MRGREIENTQRQIEKEIDKEKERDTKILMLDQQKKVSGAEGRGDFDLHIQQYCVSQILSEPMYQS